MGIWAATRTHIELWPSTTIHSNLPQQYPWEATVFIFPSVCSFTPISIRSPHFAWKRKLRQTLHSFRPFEVRRGRERSSCWGFFLFLCFIFGITAPIEFSLHHSHQKCVCTVVPRLEIGNQPYLLTIQFTSFQNKSTLMKPTSWWGR